MGFIRANRWILIGALALQIATQKSLLDYPLMPDTLPQPWYVYAQYEVGQLMLHSVEYPAIQLANFALRSAGQDVALAALFLTGFLTIASLLLACKIILMRFIGASTPSPH